MRFRANTSTCLRASSSSLAESKPRLTATETHAGLEPAPRGSPALGSQAAPPCTTPGAVPRKPAGQQAGFPLRREMEILALPNNGWDSHQNRSSGSPRHSLELGPAKPQPGRGADPGEWLSPTSPVWLWLPVQLLVLPATGPGTAEATVNCYGG